DNAHIHFARARAVTQFDSLDCKHTVADRLLEQRLTLVRNLIESPLDQDRSGHNGAQNRRHKRTEHRLKFPRRSGQQKEMRRLNPWIDIRAQIKTWRAAILVGQDLCAHMDVSLPGNTRSPSDSAHSKSLPERSQ